MASSSEFSRNFVKSPNGSPTAIIFPRNSSVFFEEHIFPRNFLGIFRRIDISSEFHRRGSTLVGLNFEQKLQWSQCVNSERLVPKTIDVREIQTLAGRRAHSLNGEYLNHSGPIPRAQFSLIYPKKHFNLYGSSIVLRFQIRKAEKLFESCNRFDRTKKATPEILPSDDNDLQRVSPSIIISD
ncbi:hypothetical protein YC2023_061350 [Brassica napus]